METPISEKQPFIQIDFTSFDILYFKYHQAVYANIWKMIRQNEAAEDILQEVFLALWENRKKLDAGKVAGWLFVTSYNKAVRHIKKKQQEQVVLNEKSSGYIVSLQEEPLNEELFNFQLSMVEEAVNQLPDRKKEVFRLCRYEGKSYDEAACILGISANSVKDYLKQSTRFIKDYISDHYAESAVTISYLLFIYLS